MESFLEANRVVEMSLNKFSRVSKGRELPLRKALLISKAMNNAQEVAESAHTSFLNSVTSRCSSRLLASMQASADVEDTAVHELDPGHVRSWSNKPRLPSPMATAQCSRPVVREETRGEDMMDMESVISSNSVLSDILSDEEDEREMEVSPSAALVDVSNSRDWSSWPEVKVTPSVVKPLPLGADSRWSTERNVNSPPLSPGKRHHSVAFPAIGENESSLFDLSEEDAKRFKPSPPDRNSLPGLYGYLSPRNLCSAPLITYMFGRGFTTPSDPTESDWPSSFSSSSLRDTVERETPPVDSGLFSQVLSPSKLCPILAY